MAISAYNLVPRPVMCLAARRSRKDPRQLSFTHVLNVVDAAWAKLIAASSQQDHDREFSPGTRSLPPNALFPNEQNIAPTHDASGGRPLGFGFRTEKRN